MQSRWLVLIILFAVAVAVGSAPPETKPVASDEELLAKAAEVAISQFSSQLQTSLKVALSEGGPVNALGVCNVVAPDIQMAHVRDGWFIERVTDRPRNRNSQADSLQLVVLGRFAASDSLASVTEWDHPQERQKFRYFKPIRVADICLNCHGDAGKLDANVKAKLAELYPNDKAVGYKVGELRGMFAVEILWPEGKAYAEKLTSGK